MSLTDKVLKTIISYYTSMWAPGVPISKRMLLENVKECCQEPLSWLKENKLVSEITSGKMYFYFPTKRALSLYEFKVGEHVKYSNFNTPAKVIQVLPDYGYVILMNRRKYAVYCLELSR